MTRKRKQRKPQVDEMWLVCVADDLRDEGCDEEFIQTCLDELREGGEVSVVFPNRKIKHLEPDK